jgi:Ankyrin repeats (3 copies)
VKKGCLLWLLQLVVLVGLYYLAFHGRFTPPADRIGALAGGFFLLLAVGAFQNAFRARKNRGRLERALAGVPFEDGQQVAAIGPITALGAPIESPFSRTNCVLCSWDISHEGRSTSSSSSDNTVRDFSGFILTPCAVNAPGGTARILAFATLEGFKEGPQTGPEAFANAESYLQSTPFEHVGLLQVFSQAKDLLTDDDGYIRKDWRMAGDDFALDPEMHTLNEEVVKDGETVCALGFYSAEKGGLVQGFGKGGEGVTLIRGGVEAGKKRLKGNVGQNIAAGIMVLLASHFFLFMFLFLREPSVRAERLEARETAFLGAARSGDLAAVQAQLGDGMEADARDSESNTPLMLTRDPEIARRLIAAGADVNARNRQASTPLIEAAKNGAAEVARLLVQHGADLEARDNERYLTALEWALQSEQPEVAQVLRAAGAKEPAPSETPEQ